MKIFWEIFPQEKLMYNYPEYYDALVGNVTSVNYSLFLACEKGRSDIVKKLLEKDGTRVEWQSILQNTYQTGFPNKYEAGHPNSNLEMVKFIIEKCNKRLNLYTAFDYVHRSNFGTHAWRIMNILDIGLSLKILSKHQIESDTDYYIQAREEKKTIINSSLSFYLIDDLLGVVDGFALWVTG